MKGPGLRIRHDVRRVFRCPRCDRVVKTAVDVTAVRCHCSEEKAWMRLETPPKTVRILREAPPPLPEPDDPGPTAADRSPTPAVGDAAQPQA